MTPAARLRREEMLNTYTHGLGALLTLVGMWFFWQAGKKEGGTLQIVAPLVYGLSLLTMYTASTLYHYRLWKTGKAPFLQKIDHASIFMLTGGSYTPYTLLGLPAAWGWPIFSFVWTLSFLGMYRKLTQGTGNRRRSTVLYVLLGWTIIIAIVPMIERFPWELWACMMGGGLFLTVGARVYMLDRIPYNHAWWHLFVMAGTGLHYFGVLWYLIPM
ncbi:MAG: hemolysin III family protein [Bacteroidota bacterium]